MGTRTLVVLAALLSGCAFQPLAFDDLQGMWFAISIPSTRDKPIPEITITGKDVAVAWGGESYSATLTLVGDGRVCGRIFMSEECFTYVWVDDESIIATWEGRDIKLRRYTRQRGYADS